MTEHTGARIFLHLVVFAGVAVLGIWFFDSHWYYVATVAAVSLAAARVVSILNPYSAGTVDAIYYTVGLIGVIVFYIQDAPDRLQAESDRALAPLLDARDRAQADLRFWAQLKEKSAELLQTLDVELNRQNLLIQVRQIEDEEEAQVEEFTEVERLACAEEFRLNNPRLFESQPPPLGGRPANLRDEALRTSAEAVCQAASDRVAAKRRAAAPPTPITWEEFLSNDSRFGSIAGRQVSVGQMIVYIAEVRDVATVFVNDDEAMARQQELVDTANKASALYEAQDDLASKAIRDLRIRRSQVVADTAFLFWPYVLILLFSLKLARPRHR